MTVSGQKREIVNISAKILKVSFGEIAVFKIKHGHDLKGSQFIYLTAVLTFRRTDKTYVF